MGIFNRKKKPDIVEKPNNNKIKVGSKKEYRVYIKDIHGSYTKKVTHFAVERFIDADNSTVWLLNNEKQFKELMPSDNDEWKRYKLEEVNSKITEIEGELSESFKKKKDLKNKKNLEYDLSIYKNYKRSLELQGRGSYLNHDEDGMPYFVFRRKGNFKFPEFDNVELDSIYTPSEAKIKEASELLDMKKVKYSKFQQNFATIVMTFFVIEMLFLGGLIMYSFKLMGAADDSAINKMQERIDEAPLFCAEIYGKAGQNFYESSIHVKNITETLVKDLHKPPTTIEGVIPN